MKSYRFSRGDDVVILCFSIAANTEGEAVEKANKELLEYEEGLSVGMEGLMARIYVTGGEVTADDIVDETDITEET
jgi:hypothetical protein